MSPGFIRLQVEAFEERALPSSVSFSGFTGLTTAVVKVGKPGVSNFLKNGVQNLVQSPPSGNLPNPLELLVDSGGNVIPPGGNTGPVVTNPPSPPPPPVPPT
ncbi:MAG: hypothetical protein R3B84_13255 [Zavarzinella sp.]